MLGIICVIIAVVMIMVAMGSSVLECEQIKRHPPDDDGCREDEQDGQPGAS